MAKVITTELQHSGASGANITLDSSKNVTIGNNLSVTGTIPADKLTGTAAAINGSNITNLPAANITGALPAISGASLTNLPASPPAFRNLIINGAMNVNQRGAYTGQGTSGKFGADRFELKGQAVGMEHAFVWQDTGMAEFPKCIRLDCTTAATGTVTEVKIVQPIESQNLVHLLWGTSSAKSITVSFWCRSNQTGTYVFWIYKDDGSRHNAKTYTISAADTWEKKTITFDGDQTTAIANDETRGLSMSWILNTGTGYSSGSSPNGTWESLTDVNRYAGQTATIGGNTNDYYDLTGVQVEEGTTATDFEHRNWHDELLRCQRYYWQFPIDSERGEDLNGILGLGHSISTTELTVPVQNPVYMRVPPTLENVTGMTNTWNSQHGGGNWGTWTMGGTWGTATNNLHSWVKFTGSGATSDESVLIYRSDSATESVVGFDSEI